MKKPSIFLIALLICSVTFGQWSVGPRLGVNFSTLTGTWNSDDDSKSRWIGGLAAGIVGSYSFSEKYAVSSELLYIPMGEKTIYSNGESRSVNEQNYSTRERYNCMQWLIVGKVLFGNGSLSFFAFLGPYLTYKFSGRWKDESGNKGDIKWREDPGRKSSGDILYIDPKYNRRFDMGMYIGGGAGKELGPGKLNLNLRFGFGFLDLNKFDSKEDKQNAKDNGYKPYRSLNISLTLAYMYSFDKK